jgi:hypothetical protein
LRVQVPALPAAAVAELALELELPVSVPWRSARRQRSRFPRLPRLTAALRGPRFRGSFLAISEGFLWQVMFRCHSNLKKWSIFGLNARTSSQIQALHSKNRETIDSKRLNLWSVLELVENGRH